ncbi:MAG: hypothetical protein WEF50_12030 [Myxococcota bacterium]
MRIHGIQLRGLTAPTGDHQLALDPGYTVVRCAEPATARSVLQLVRALLHPESARATAGDSRGRALLTLALRADGCLVAADFARGRVSLGRLDAKGGGNKALSSDAHEIEEYLLAIGLPAANEFERLHVFGAKPAHGARASAQPIAPVSPPRPRSAPVARNPQDETARVQAERAKLVAEHEARSRALGAEHERLTRELETALALAASQRERDQARIAELRSLDAEHARLEQEHKTTQAELEKNTALAETVEDFDTRLAVFRTLAAEHDEERAIVEDKRLDLLADRARLREVPRRQRVPILLGLALGAAGAAVGAVGYPAGYGLAAVGVLALLAALLATRIARAKLTRIETLLAVLRVRERTAERRFASEGAQVRGLMLALGVDSLDALKVAAQGFAELVDKAAAQKRHLAELAERHPPEARAELRLLEQAGGDVEANPAVRAARDALLACPTAVVMPELPAVVSSVPAPAEQFLQTDADTAVDLLEKPEEEPEPAAVELGPELLVEATGRVLGRSEAEVRARLAPVLPVYLRALSTGIFTNARADSGGWLLRGAAREEQPFAELPDRERELVRLAVQLALLEALAGDRRVPLLVGPDLPARGEAEQRALARAFKRLASVVQVVQFATASAPWAEHAGKSFEL